METASRQAESGVVESYQRAHNAQQALVSGPGVFVDPATDHVTIRLRPKKFADLFGNIPDAQVDGKAIVWRDCWLNGLWPSQIEKLVVTRKDGMFCIEVVPKKEQK